MTNSVCNYGQDSTRPPGPATDRYGDAHTSRFARPLAGRATLISIDELVLVAQNVRAGAAAASVVGFCRWPRRTAGRGLGSLSPFGDGVDQSVVAALVASGMRRAGSTGRDRVTGIAATTTPRRNGDETETRLGSPAKGRQSPAAAGMELLAVIERTPACRDRVALRKVLIDKDLSKGPENAYPSYGKFLWVRLGSVPGVLESNRPGGNPTGVAHRTSTGTH